MYVETSIIILIAYSSSFRVSQMSGLYFSLQCCHESLGVYIICVLIFRVAWYLICWPHKSPQLPHPVRPRSKSQAEMFVAAVTDKLVYHGKHDRLQSTVSDGISRARISQSVVQRQQRAQSLNVGSEVGIRVLEGRKGGNTCSKYKWCLMIMIITDIVLLLQEQFSKNISLINDV